MNRLFLLISLTCLITITGQVFGQSEVAFDTTIVHRDGRVMRIRINGTDTVVVATMPEVVIKAPPVFSNDEEYRQYMRYRRYAMDVLPYEFTDPLKNLSRTQGKILVKMIERHLNTSTYDILRDVRGGFNAMKWQTVGKLYGYDLKEGYIPGQDRIMDMILRDFEITVE